jgi:hypothetical protein
MIQIIPVSNYPDQRFRLTLEGVPLSVRVWWSAFDSITADLVGDDIQGQWYLDMASTDGTIVINGMALVTGCDMLEPYAFDGLGGLWLADDEGRARDPGLDDLGVIHTLYYVPRSDRASFNSAIGWAR